MNNIKFSGKEAAAAIYEQLATNLSTLSSMGITPTLDIILAGDDEASILYARRKIKAAEKLGLKANLHQLPDTVGPSAFNALLDGLNNSAACHGIIIEQPLPKQLPKWPAINPLKDLDGASMASLGALLAGEPLFVPATAAAAFLAIKSFARDLSGRKVTLIGRSLVVGKPLALLLCNANATVTLCHSYTKELCRCTQNSDIIVAATGHPDLITSDMVPEGAILIDVGTTPTADGLKGDINPACYEKAAFFTPVPGGIGPVTVAILLQNLVQAAARQNGVKL